jgi:hypothetical protein
MLFSLIDGLSAHADIDRLMRRGAILSVDAMCSLNFCNKHAPACANLIFRPSGIAQPAVILRQ